ncbi:hypothetical protein JZ751_028753 [Albula glossodonta]|uniref:Uncharacterized protein n=1 Tax=Albula glossodonta TaxID=121402 RepID=A0A8T2MZT2_9TELE|nr:hypothetical protein JZ751_028753 [Albula glossodonta]
MGTSLRNPVPFEINSDQVQCTSHFTLLVLCSIQPHCDRENDALPSLSTVVKASCFTIQDKTPGGLLCPSVMYGSMKLHSSERAFIVSCSWVKQDCRVSGHLSSRGRSGRPDTPEHWETEDDTPVAWTHSLSVTKLEEE